MAASLGFLGCKPAENAIIGPISGQVFIVTKGAESVKLGAVGIVVFERRQVEDADEADVDGP